MKTFNELVLYKINKHHKNIQSCIVNSRQLTNSKTKNVIEFAITGLNNV